MIDAKTGGGMIRNLAWLGPLLLLMACGAPGPLSDLEPGEKGRVVRVVDGDTIVLDTGQSVRLVGIEAPAGGYGDRAPQPFHKESRRMMEDMVLGREVQLHYGGLTRDRYDRALAQARTIDALGADYWLNAEIVRRGGARVRVYPDTAAANAALLDIEAEARQANIGLWASNAYDIANADDLPDPFSGFQLVQGNVTGMQGSDGFGAVCDLSLERSGLTLQIQTAAATLCQEAVRHRVLARGYVREGRMEITHPLNLEILEAAIP